MSFLSGRGRKGNRFELGKKVRKEKESGFGIMAPFADFPLGAIFVNALRIIAGYGKYLRELVEKPVHDIGTTIRKLARKAKTGYLDGDLFEP